MLVGGRVFRELVSASHHSGVAKSCRPVSVEDGGSRMSIDCDYLIREIVRDESLTRGLGDEEARMLVEWVVDWAELLAGAARSDDDARELVNRVRRRGRAIGRFVNLWCDQDHHDRGGATQLAASERFAWPLPINQIDPPDLMQQILCWENQHPVE
jgi:hypothetical protein